MQYLTKTLTKKLITIQKATALRPNLSTFCSPQSSEASRLPQYERLPNPTSELDCLLQAILCMNH
jgi:hypothetical protein